MRGQILEILRTEDGIVSGEVLSEKLGISRVSVWKHIQKLEKCGYEILSMPKGYRLLHSPDIPFPWEFPDRENRIHYFEEAESTMDIARSLARKGCPNFTVVIAGRQTKGRGRLQRVWHSSEGGLYFTIVCRLHIPPQQSSKISFAASLCLAKMFREVFGIAADVKWPNDILVQGRKLCGMLSEMEANDDLLSFVNIGMGINISNHPNLEEPKAVSAKEILNRDLSPKEVLSEFLNRFESYLPALNPDTVISDWKKYTVTIGQRVRIVTIRDESYGLATDVDNDGSLMLQTDDGAIRKIVYGDCFHQESE